MLCPGRNDVQANRVLSAKVDKVQTFPCRIWYWGQKGSMLGAYIVRMIRTAFEMIRRIILNYKYVSSFCSAARFTHFSSPSTCYRIVRIPSSSKWVSRTFSSSKQFWLASLLCWSGLDISWRCSMASTSDRKLRSILSHVSWAHVWNHHSSAYWIQNAGKPWVIIPLFNSKCSYVQSNHPVG